MSFASCHSGDGLVGGPKGETGARDQSVEHGGRTLHCFDECQRFLISFQKELRDQENAETLAQFTPVYP